MPETRLAVLGSPIAHSLSPRLHRAAYDVLGLEWTYDAIDMAEAALPEFVGSCGPSWRGLSLTMPLKRTVIPLLDSVDAIGTLTNAVNTVLLSDGERFGFNTDVEGARRAIAATGVESVTTALVLGGGATAGSIIVALAGLGLEHATIAVRSPERAAEAIRVARDAGVATSTIGLAELDDQGVPSIVANTIPAANGAPHLPADVHAAPLFEASYDPWPTPLSTAWDHDGGIVVPGIDMLINQALIQVRIFVAGDPSMPLIDESAVLTAMRSSVGR